MKKIIMIIGSVTLISILAKVLSFFREVIIAGQYGASYITDAITVAYTIPNFLYLVVGGALTTAFISVYHSTNSEKLSFIQKSFSTVFIIALIMTGISLLFMNPIIHFFYRDRVPEEYVASFTLTRNLYLWMILSTAILILSSWLSGLLNINGNFNFPSISILIYNFLFLIVGWILTPIFGAESYSIGALFSAMMMGIFLLAGIYKVNNKFLRFSFSVSDDSKRLLIMALPILLGGASLQFYFVIHRIVAGMLDQGTITAVNLASKLSGLPQGILMAAVTTVIYPLLSKIEGEGKEEELRKLYKKGIKYLLLIFIPFTVITYFFADPLVRLVFQRGNYGDESVQMTVPLFQVFTLSMFFLSANTFVTRFYYIKENSLLPVIFSLVSVFGINIGVIFLMIESEGSLAIPYGTLVSSIANFLLLIIYARYKWKL